MSQRILIIGAGFAGLHSALAARRLITMATEQGAAKGTGDIEIAMIAPQPRLAILPRLYEEDPNSKVAPLGDILATVGVRFIQGMVDEIDTAKQEVRYSGGETTNSGSHSITYNRLVLAAGGSVSRPAGVLGLEHAFTVDGVEKAAQLESHFKQLALREPSKTRGTVVVCGGGFTGIEVAAELPKRLGNILGSDASSSSSSPNIRVVVVERADVIAPDMAPGMRPFISESLQGLGVEVRLGAAVVGIEKDSGSGDATVRLSSGDRIEAATVVWTAGTVASPLAAQIPGDKEARSGRVRVDEHLRAPSAPTCFVAGDVALAVADAADGGGGGGHHARIQPVYVTCLDLGAAGSLAGVGWDTVVTSAGHAAKPLKRYINETLIYPAHDLASLLAAGDPANTNASAIGALGSYFRLPGEGGIASCA
ncbi:hypothetical protein GGTG_03178 [Gaeumannomyces tritici R3-111a-1]|uniref:FAD/NAD(P)-binding domain-containing protein n=1 Tax=Gaeumannomyces tritici (strain R3-111a-1) TaxID=644352 RepID=J3NPH0_GAET3|nr:hypothetical protein GGTG_03178 [Gaeumannomyces tritici R3-111a-1]EJT78075.1 hypothetical protein GGTG_03178 [Gaeumannomyces tritici R3-111a-1]